MIYNNIDAVKYLLDNGADIHYRNDEALNVAVSHDNSSLVKILLQFGADVHTQNESPLFRAVSIRNVELIRILLEAGAVIANDLVERARSSGDPKIFQLLRS